MSTASRAITKGKKKLKDALGEWDSEDDDDDVVTVSDWNKRKTEAEANGEWSWKKSTSIGTHGTRSREKVSATIFSLKSALPDLAMQLITPNAGKPMLEKAAGLEKCEWRQIINGKMYNCTNAPSCDIVEDISKKKSSSASKRRVRVWCPWHQPDCLSTTHSSLDEKGSRKIIMPNVDALCLGCYQKEHSQERLHLQKPTLFTKTTIPGVMEVDMMRLKESALLGTNEVGNLRKVLKTPFTSESRCGYKARDAKHRLFSCTNLVIQQPRTSVFLGHCGYHVSQCIRSLPPSTTKCPNLQVFTSLGLCKNHLASTQNDTRIKNLRPRSNGRPRSKDKYSVRPRSRERPRSSVRVLEYPTQMDVPGVIKGEKKEVQVKVIAAHPLAPRYLPFEMAHFEEAPVPIYLQHFRNFVALENPVSRSLRHSMWYITLKRKGPRLATLIQRMYRGRQARSMVNRIRSEQQALKRVRALQIIQRQCRKKLGKNKFKKHHSHILKATPLLQRMMRGFLGRRRVVTMRSASTVTSFFRGCQARIRAYDERMEGRKLKRLQSVSMDHYLDHLAEVAKFTRKRSVILLQRRVVAWRGRKQHGNTADRRKLLNYLAAGKLQKWWRNLKAKQAHQVRTGAAKIVQRHARGRLSRILWASDPGIKWITCHVRSKSGFKYMKGIIGPIRNGSYSVPCRRIRLHFAANTIQRLYRGYLSRLYANTAWVEMNERWDYLLGKGSTLADRAKHKKLLPSFSYSHKKSEHMRLPADLPPNESGFAYEYQYMLDMMEDVNGLRYPTVSHAVEKKGKNDDENASDIIEDESEGPKRKRVEKGSYSVKGVLERCEPQMINRKFQNRIGVSDTIARFPLGAVVQVDMPTGKLHEGIITNVNVQQERFNVKYKRAFYSKAGIPLYREFSVPASRLHTHPEPNQQPKMSLTFQAGIDALQHDIEQTRLDEKLAKEPEGRTLFTSTPQRLQAKIVPRPTSRVHEARMYMSIIVSLRNTEVHLDLVADHRDLVSFAFQNIYMMEKYWLRMVHDIKCGTMSASLPTLKGKTSEKISSKSLPERALRIEKILAKCGFQYDPKFCQCPPDLATYAAKTTAPLSKDNTISTKESHRHSLQHPKDVHEVSNLPYDDIELGNSDRIDTSEIHRIQYELETMPRDSWREEIITIATRTTRAYLCGHPACGQCFCDRQAVRLHQQRAHKNKMRLGGPSTPTTDQYMHKYWPPKSPWKEAPVGSKVGYMKCLQCTEEFTRRSHLHEHVQKMHPRRLSAPPAALTGHMLNIKWLSPPISIQHLNELVRNAHNSATCQLHSVFQSSCDSCQSQAASPILPGFSYTKVLVKFQNLSVQKVEHALFENARETQFCPLVSRNEKCSIYVQVTAYCLDVSGNAWGVGYPYDFPPYCDTRDEELTCGFDMKYEVILDNTKLWYFRLEHICGYAFIPLCSRGMFYRKHLAGSQAIPRRFFKTTRKKLNCMK